MFKTLTDGCEPTRGSKFSACVDLYASEDMVIGAGETKIIGLGVAIDLEKLIENSHGMFNESSFDGMSGGWIGGEFSQSRFDEFMMNHYLQLNPRSSIRAKGVISHTGIIDIDYPKEIKIIIHNPIKNGFLFKVVQKIDDVIKDLANIAILSGYVTIKKGDRIAQITLLEHKGYLFGIESEDERTGGFGSTNKKENHV